MPMLFINYAYTIYYWRLGHSPTGQYGRFHRIGHITTNAKCTPHRRWVVRPLQGQSASIYNCTSRVYDYHKTSSQGQRQTANEKSVINLTYGYGPMRSMWSMRCFVGPVREGAWRARRARACNGCRVARYPVFYRSSRISAPICRLPERSYPGDEISCISIRTWHHLPVTSHHTPMGLAWSP